MEVDGDGEAPCTGQEDHTRLDGCESLLLCSWVPTRNQGRGSDAARGGQTGDGTRVAACCEKDQHANAAEVSIASTDRHAHPTDTPEPRRTHLPHRSAHRMPPCAKVRQNSPSQTGSEQAADDVDGAQHP